MRRVAFSVLGGVGGSTARRGTLADLLREIPSLLSAGLIPPMRVVNDLLRRGICDAGMSGGCTWKPFEISLSEWDELASRLRAGRRGGACRFVEPPEWVETVEDWSVWVMIVAHGLPEAFRHLERESRDADRAHREAARAGNTELAEELEQRATEANERLAEFVMKHRRNTAT